MTPADRPTPTDLDARRAELAAGMAQAGARLPRDWPKDMPPANPAVEDDDKRGDKNDE